MRLSGLYHQNLDRKFQQHHKQYHYELIRRNSHQKTQSLGINLLVLRVQFTNIFIKINAMKLGKALTESMQRETRSI